jgi:hypothetical protein
MRSQELVFPETAEQLVVEKEAFVREEVVLRKLVENHVEEIEDRVKRTEVEVERISPGEAQRILERAAPEAEEIEHRDNLTPAEVERISPDEAQRISKPAASEAPAMSSPPPPRAKPVVDGNSRAARTSSNSKAWWAWFALILFAGVLAAFAVGQFLGAAS